jgi:hypothetical protein
MQHSIHGGAAAAVFGRKRRRRIGARQSHGAESVGNGDRLFLIYLQFFAHLFLRSLRLRTFKTGR